VSIDLKKIAGRNAHVFGKAITNLKLNAQCVFLECLSVANRRALDTEAHLETAKCVKNI